MLQTKLLSARVAKGTSAVLAGEQGRPGLGGSATIYWGAPLWGHPAWMAR